MSASSSRAAGFALGFLSLLALVVWFALGDRGSRIFSDPDAGSAGSVAEVSGALSAPEEGMRGVERERVATFSPAPPGGGSGDLSSREGVSSPEDPDDWRRCFTDPDPIRVRECVRARLGGRILSPEELARMVCSGAPPDAASRLLIGIVAADWPATALASDVLSFQSLCDSSPAFWTSFLRERVAEDAEYGRAFAASLRARLLTEAKGTALLEMAAVLAEEGDEEIRQMLVSIAIGIVSGSESQTAFALARTSHWRGSARETLEFLDGAFYLQDALGGTRTGAELARILLRQDLVSEVPDLAGKLFERLLADSDTGPAAAKVLLDAERFGTLPLGYMDELLQDLLATARTFE